MNEERRQRAATGLRNGVFISGLVAYVAALAYMSGSGLDRNQTALILLVFPLIGLPFGGLVGWLVAGGGRGDA